MNKHKSLLRRIIPFVIAVMAAAQLSARPWPHSGSDLPVDPIVEWGRMDNGIRYVIMPWAEPPGRASLRILIEAGSIHESERQKGLAHVIEHMAFNGTRNYSAGEMVEYFQRLGMDFGADTNAHTWWRETVYKLELPDTDESLLRDGLQLLRDYADGILFLEDEIEKEKGVVLSEYRDRNSAGFIAYRDGLKFALPDSRISERITIGDEDVIRMASRKDLVDFYNKWYTPERMVLIAVGDFDPDMIEALLAEYFADMRRSGEPAPEPDYGKINPEETKSRLFSHHELPMGGLEIYTRRQIEPRTDTLDTRMDEIAIGLGNAIVSRRFEKLSKAEDAPFSRGSGYGYRWLDFVQYQGVSMSFEPLDWDKALDVATTELNRAIRYGFTQAELDEARANLINGLEEAAARAATRKSRDLSSALVRSVRDNEVFTDPVMRRDLLVPRIDEMTLEQVNAAFKDLWESQERMVNIEGNFDRLVSDKFLELAAKDVEPPVEEAVMPWAYTRFGTTGKVVEKNYVDDLGIHQYRLSNNVRLNIKKTDYEANKIHVKASFGTGTLSVPADKPGLALYAGATFIAGGLGEHSNDEINALMAGKTVGAGFSVEDNEFSIGGVTNKDDLLLQLQLMAANLVDPGYRPEAGRLFSRQLDGLYSQLAHDPNAVMQNEVARFLAGGDQRFGFPERDQLEQRNSSEVKKWLQDTLSGGYLELSVVGDFPDEEKVLADVLETFGAMPKRNPERPRMEEARVVNFPMEPKSKVFTYESDIPRAMAVVSWPTTDQSDIFETRRLSVLGSVFSDRLRVQVREEIGEAYSPYAYNNSSDTYTDYGVFQAIVGVEPGKAGMIQDILVRIGSDLAGSGIDKDELVRAIEPIKNQIEEYRRTNGYWLNSVLSRSQYEPVRLDWARSFEGFWETITPRQISDLARLYLKPDNGVKVQVQPE